MRLICFGDSWTAGHGIETDSKFKGIPHPLEGNNFIQKWRSQNSWPRWVSDKLKCEFINCGVCGYGNQYILNDIKSIIDNNFLNSSDIIIVMFSYPYRYGDCNPIEIYNEMEIILNDYKHFYFNAFYPIFKDEDYDTSNLPDYFINPNNSVSDVLRECEIKNNEYVWEYRYRSVWNDSKSFWEGYYHPNLKGYKIISDYIYNSICDKL
jgi:lysophospholipase L1-like esterase